MHKNEPAVNAAGPFIRVMIDRSSDVIVALAKVDRVQTVSTGNPAPDHALKPPSRCALLA